MQVFEHMEMNLRELTRKVGVGCGIKIDAVAQLAFQMLVALKHLTACKVLHADIKPDNILINARMNKVKLCDLGSALFAGGANDPTPYLVSRFYRAPEVMLGLPYGARCAWLRKSHCLWFRADLRSLWRSVRAEHHMCSG
jgi:serine/threonine-protein kinase PRP4